MDLAQPAQRLVAVRRALSRPAGFAEQARWLFAGFTLVSLVLGVPDAVSPSHGLMRLAVVLSLLVLIGSALYTYRAKRTTTTLSILDAVAVGGITLASSDPMQMFGYIFVATWFYALYSSTWRAVVRCGLIVAALGVTLICWPLMPGHSGSLDTMGWLRALPLLVVSVAVARQLGGGLLLREQALSRDGVLATAGTQLLGVTDPDLIRDLGWSASAELCAVTPGLRLLKVRLVGEILRVERTAGSFVAVPASLPGSAITTTRGPGEARVTDTSSLDACVGARAAWDCVRIIEPKDDVWVVLGAPRKITSEVQLAVQSLVNQVTLALHSSDSHHELTAQARMDSLTELANRATFTSELTAELLDTDLLADLHVLFIDLDDFKNVNDVLGHRAGDELLVEVARRLLDCAGPKDTCVRLGGDEFGVLVRGAGSADQAAILAQSMVDAIAVPIRLSGRTRRVGASIGIATPTPGVGIDELVHQADVAMYAAKAHGKGRVQIFDSGLLQADTSRLIFARELAAATMAGEIVVHYQPVLSLPDCRCTAVEALVRWEHPTRGLLQPGEFIEAAEQTGAIIDIGAFALRLACADVAEWRTEHPDQALSVHVNVSAGQLDHDQFISTVLECLELSELPADRLVLELTETVLLSSPAAIDRLKLLASHGVQIGIDDFGTGYSSLTTLRSLPVNVVKLDTSFIAGALTNAVDRTVIRAIVQMSTNLGLLTIAEGVERPEQQQFLAEVGTSAVQGYLYLRPVPANELSTWLDGNLGVDEVGQSAGAPVSLLRPQKPRVA